MRLDNAVMEVKAGWPALLKNTRHIGDFTRWKEHDAGEDLVGMDACFLEVLAVEE